MLDFDKLIKNLGAVSRRHALLSATFETFAKLVTDNLSAQGFPVPGITCANYPNRFTAALAGRSLDFVFSSSMGSEGSLNGLVQCYLSASYPNEGRELVNSFVFKANGETDMTCPLHGDILIITNDTHAMQIVCQYVYESLSRNC